MNRSVSVAAQAGDQSVQSRSGHRWARITLIVSLTLWGLLHVVGGASLVVASTQDSLTQLGTALDAGPPDVGEAAAAVVRFHGFNIAAAGVVVILAAVAVARRRDRAWLVPSLLLMTVLDVGLIVFLLVPGVLKWTDGVWGPALLVVALTSYGVSRRVHSPASRVGGDARRTHHVQR